MERPGKDAILNIKKIKIFVTIRPFVILVISGLVFDEISLLTGIIAVEPTWYYAWFKDEKK